MFSLWFRLFWLWAVSGIRYQETNINKYALCLELVPIQPPPPPFGGQIQPNLPKSSAELLGFWILPKCYTNLLGFCILGLQWGNSGVAWQRMTCECIMKWGPPFMFFMSVVQIDTMKCFYCPQKDVSLVPWDSLSPADQKFLQVKYPDAGQGAVCDFCVRSTRPSPFFNRCSSGALSSAPPISGFWAAGAFSCVRCSHVFGHRVSGSWGSMCASVFLWQALLVHSAFFPSN